MTTSWTPGTAPLAVVMISLNEAHHLEGALASLAGFAKEVFLVDSCSKDATVDIALAHGVHVVQRSFRGFGDQWNFALRELPITAPWTMKLDPDERLTEELKREILAATSRPGAATSFEIPIRLTFLGRRLPVVLRLVRLWKTGEATFSDVPANEHAMSVSPPARLSSEILHLDSPDLHHWVEKQNNYTTAEALNQFDGAGLSARPRLFGTSLERRMWLKTHFWRIPGRYIVLFWYHFLILGGWRAGKAGWIWAQLRTMVYRLWEYKKYELDLRGAPCPPRPSGPGAPDPRVRFYE